MAVDDSEAKLLNEIIQLREKLNKARSKARDESMIDASRESNLRSFPRAPSLATVFNLRAHASKVYDALWTPTDQFAITVGGEGLIIVWEVTSGLIHNVLDVGTIKPVTAAASGDASIIFCGGLCANVVVFNSRHESAEDGYSVYENAMVYEHSGQVNSINRIQDTQILTSTPIDGALLWDVERVKIVGRFPHPMSSVECVTLLTTTEQAMSNSFITCTNDGVVRHWDIRQPKKIALTFEGHEATINCVRPLSNGHNFVTGSDDAFIHLYDTRTDVILATYSDPYLATHSSSMDLETTATITDEGGGAVTPGVCDLAVSSSGRLILSGCRDSIIYFWDIAQTDHCVHRVTEIGPIVRLAMSNRKSALLLMTWDAKSRVRIVRPR